MAEYIDREKMLKYLEENNTADEWIVGQYNADWIYSFIESQPTADVEEVREARWKGAGVGDYYCSLCQETVGGNNFRFCPYCGAKMDGERRDT